jgi:uncharacterized membrane protein (UPF0136 family)
MAAHNGHTSEVAGTVGGTVLTIIGSLQLHDLVKTVILATVGAVVSFTLSMLMKWLAKKMGRPRN